MLCGIHQFHLHYIQSEDGESLFNLCCEGSELLLKLGKTYVKEKGTGKMDCLDHLADFYDLHNLGSIMAGITDLSQALALRNQTKLLIFDPDETPAKERELEMKMPPLMQHLIESLKTIEFGDNIPVNLHKILSADITEETVARRKALRESLNNGERFVLASDEELEVIVDEYLQMGNDNDDE